uniref:Uncharacterized protein n=1 Tax=Gasterosteus aculeatus aculeatus TaxID=481459 RepID=A0AAQ4PL34_GASAC
MDARPLIPDRDPKRDTEGNECDVIAEPPSVRTFDHVWSWMPISLAAGILCAMTSFLHVWL